MYYVSIIVATIWFLWKSYCDAIFKNSTPNYSLIVNRAIAHMDFNQENANLRGRCLLLNNFNQADGLFLFFTALSQMLITSSLLQVAVLPLLSRVLLLRFRPWMLPYG
ncbi:FMN-binding split barrel-containing protein [Dioscorea alata]|uniref:FMN-binding split barrel-containing protein n=1 Tax=Dioscorea alata TaxID=55571 RepID=A0ACB7WAJ3_DIOAL|nr:FMN-binding split barrel-containing protein [Dioscorea alata]